MVVVPDQHRILPLLALRNLAAFPGQEVHIDVTRKFSLKALTFAMAADRTVFLAAQRNPSEENPTPDGFYTVGTVARILQLNKLPDNQMRVCVRVLNRAEAVSLPKEKNGVFTADVTELEETDCPFSVNAELEAYRRRILAGYEELAQFSENLTVDLLLKAAEIQTLGLLCDTVAQTLYLPQEERQMLLETTDISARAEVLIRLLGTETEVAQLECKIADRTRERLSKAQKDFYVREQIHALEEELGEEDPDEEIYKYTDLINRSACPKEIKEKLFKEVDRLSKMPISAPEAGVSRIYLDTVLDLPWGVYTQEKVDYQRAKEILDEDHYGLDKIKKRILETVTVLRHMPEYNGQILCLVGPPGTGKTSIAKSIARATGRNFARVSLGGVHDEAEIRGHRRTYVAAMPGKIIEAISDAKSMNPVILLDEIDKVGNDYRGDPASALLEVLDPEQNSTYKDHFLDLPFDLSHVLFLLTANTAETIPAALLDRTEILELSSYTQTEKVAISKRHLLPKQRKKHGLTAGQFKMTDAALNDLIRSYSREAGVRILERNIASLCRKALTRFEEDPELRCVTVRPGNIEEFLGPRHYHEDDLPKEDTVGVVTGLAYTTVGGEVMPIEVSVMEGTGKIQLTGLLGDVMKESANAAISYIRAHAAELKVSESFYKDKDIHIHVPEGAIPKDGPSAGVTMTTALVSALTGRPVDHTVAMTGEITLRGRVLPIGGLKEKTMAAYKAGVKTVLLPQGNVPDLAEIDGEVKEHLTFRPVSDVGQVLGFVLRG